MFVYDKVVMGELSGRFVCLSFPTLLLADLTSVDTGKHICYAQPTIRASGSLTTNQINQERVQKAPFVSSKKKVLGVLYCFVSSKKALL